jgi:PhzF family phenazine biosynthesis protein
VPRRLCLGYAGSVTTVRLRTVDSFTDRPFAGNPAAVVVLDDTPPDDWMAALARETAVSDTAFVIRETSPDADFRLRWFTPGTEVDLCGHATLAAAHCLFDDGASAPIRFATRSGVLAVSRHLDGSLVMDFPSWPPAQIDAPTGLAEALGAPVQWTGKTENDFFLLALLANEAAVRELTPDITKLACLDAPAFIVTAAAEVEKAYDFVSRLFAPTVGVAEDPVTGSSHTVLAPYWASRLGKTSLTGFQASARSGFVRVEMGGDRVAIIGRAVTVMDGVLTPTANPA